MRIMRPVTSGRFTLYLHVSCLGTQWADPSGWEVCMWCQQSGGAWTPLYAELPKDEREGLERER